MSEPCIRPATPEDAQELHRLVMAHAEFERGKATVTPEQLVALLSSGEPGAYVIVCELSKRLVGYAAITQDYSIWRAHTWAHLDCLYVDEGKRNSGLGTGLLKAACAYAVSVGADQLEWQTPEWNRRAVSFYERHGAQSVSKRRFMLVL